MQYYKNPMGGGIPSPESYKDCVTLIQSDYYRIEGKICHLWHIIKVSRYNNAVWVLLLFRLCQYQGFLSPIFMRLYLRACKKYNIFLPHTTKVGYGFYIGHGFGLVVNGTAIIGNNVNLSQFTTIGSNRDKAAHIGDNVYVGPSVCIVENVQIGCCANIGAGAVVVKDVSQNATVAGVPAKMVKEHNGKTSNKNPYLTIMD